MSEHSKGSYFTEMAKSLNCANPPRHHLKISVGSSSCAYINEEISHKEN
jgi:hypothetical protein